jgi:chemotaxis protein MotA
VFGENMHMPTVVAQLVKASDRVRMSGRASAVGSPRDVDDAFMRTGLQYVAEGLDPAEIRALLDSELSAIRSRHRMGIGLFEAMGGFAPTFGILGTVEAMIAILGNLTTPDKLGPEIALAMVATLYGVGFANLLFVPIATRLRKLSEEELRARQLVLEVIVSIQEGAKPEFIRERLRVSLPPETRRTIAALSERKARKQKRTAQMDQPAMTYEDDMMGSVPMDGDLY